MTTAPAGPGFWAVMRHEDVQYVSRTPELFSAGLGGTQLRDPDPQDLPYLRKMLLNMDPPEHNKYRRIVSGVFTRSHLAKFDQFVGTRIDELMEPLRDGGTFDIVTEVTDDLSLSTLAYVLGVPPGDRRFFFDWANRIIGYHDDEFSDSGTVDRRSPSELTDMIEYASSLANYRREHPGDDLISLLVNAKVEGQRLSKDQYQNFFFLLAVAGNDTTRSALPGALLALTEHPDQYALIRKDRALIDTAVEECLRYAPPVVHFRRTATSDTVLRGQPIRRGDKVVVFYPSANRDSAVFDRPDVFDVTRTSRAHVTFGYGPHICVAAALARLQMRHVLARVVESFCEMGLAGPVDRLKSNFVAGIKRLPVELTV
ncbi:cytochrome P450 [Streptomyces sp. NPDC017520]|uniref:cytochrome P450 n=1 Tax=Streptomyces sp. NPDC017520 TaxID=3364998 RepID=UPI0037AB9ABD